MFSECMPFRHQTEKRSIVPYGSASVSIGLTNGYRRWSHGTQCECGLICTSFLLAKGTITLLLDNENHSVIIMAAY